MYWDKEVDLKTIIGKKIVDIKGLEKSSDEVRIFTEDGNEYLFYHEDDCCESVDLNDFEGDIDKLIGSVILSAEVVTNDSDEDENKDEKPSEYSESWTWTFYKIETDKGGLWMRWLGESNGYYSESVNFVWVNKPEQDA